MTSMKNENNKREVKMEVVVNASGQRIDLNEIAIGPKDKCRTIVIEGRECLQVSRPVEFAVPMCKAVDKLKKSLIVDLKRNAMVADLHVCYEAAYDEKNEPYAIWDDGFTMEGDNDEFGHYILWNEATGELSVSDEIGWENYSIPFEEHLADAKRAEKDWRCE